MASPTWYIERIPAAGGASDTRTLSAWGIDSMTITDQAWGIGGADIGIPSDTAGTTAPAWADRDHLVVWEGNPAAGGTRRAHLWVLIPGLSAAPEAESHGYRLVGPWWWLESTQFFYPLHVVDITTDPETHAATGCTWEMRHGTEVVWTSWADQSTGTVKGQLHRALWCAIDNDAPIAIGTIDITGYANVPAEQTGTCADVAARAARYSPRCSQWWDHSGAVPVFHAAGYSARPAVTLALGPASSGWSLAPRHDLRVDVVRIGYQWEDDVGPGAWYDIAGDDTLKDGPHTLRTLVDCPDEHFAAQASMHYGIAAQLYAALHSVPYDGSVSWPDWGSGVPVVHPGHALNLTGSIAELESMAAPIASVALTITSAAVDALTVTLGLPDTLGANDLFEMYNLALNLTSGAVDTDGGTGEPATTPVPGTVAELNGADPFESNPSGTIATQVRGGTWVKQGWASSNGSEPTRRWLTATVSGGTTTRGYGNPEGTGDYILTVESFAGSVSVDPATGVRTGSWTRHHAYTYPDNSTASADVEWAASSEYVLLGNSVLTWLQQDGRVTMVQSLTTTTIAVVPHSAGNYYVVTDASAAITKSNEDTTTAARTRMLSDVDWTVADGPTAIATVPTTTAGGTYREIRVGTYSGADYTPLSGMIRWQRYRLAIALRSRAVNESGAPTGDWSDAGVVYSAPWVTDLDGKGGCEWVVITPDDGLEVEIASITPEIF